MKRKKCTRCGKTRLIKFFSPRKNRAPDSVHSWCNVCRVDDKHKRYASLTEEQRFQKHLTTKRSHLMRSYKITLEEYIKKAKEQKNRCAICNKVQPESHTLKGYKKNALGKRGKDRFNLYVDHNHETEEVRGLLCNECNLAYGYIKENTKSIKGMLDYHEKWRKVA